MDFITLTKKKKKLDRYRPPPEEISENLDDWFAIELVYTSNAIEGNTLTRAETTVVLREGLVVSGKTLKEHMEAKNHAEALAWVKRNLDRTPQDITEQDILHIHSLILKGIGDASAGRYRNVPVRIPGSSTAYDYPSKIPELMRGFIEWLRGAKKLHPVELAAGAHYRLVTIHPFTDGNGRTARLLMNMILMMCGYPITIIKKSERIAYLKSLEEAQTKGSGINFLKLIMRASARSLDAYIKAARGEGITIEEERLLKIGQLAKAAKVTQGTIRHWSKIGLLQHAGSTKAGFLLYTENTVERILRIQELKNNRFTLKEIKEKLELAN